MGFSDIGLRHIVDIDGQLLGIDAEVIDTASLLARANCPANSLLWMVHAGERVAIEREQTPQPAQPPASDLSPWALGRESPPNQAVVLVLEFPSSEA